MNKDELKHRLSIGFNYLLNQIQDSGKFVYERDKDGKRIKGSYNMLRHAGAIWALKLINANSHHYHLNGNTARIDLAYSYMKKKSYIEPDMAHVNCNSSIKAGGDALGILAGIGSLDIEYRNKLEKGLQAFISKNRLKAHKLNGANGQYKLDPFISEYYPGEVALALCYQRRYDQVRPFVKNLRNERDAEKQLQDHWLAQALYLMYTQDKMPDKDFIEAYAERIEEAITSNKGDYHGRSVRIACRLEAMVPIHKITKDPFTKIFCEELLEDLLEYQCLDKESILYGGFIDKDTYRIDYTQHAICGILAYLLI